MLETIFVVLAQVSEIGEPVAAPSPPWWSGILTPGNVGWAVTAVLAAVAGVLQLNEVRRRRIALAAYHAFQIVEDVARETEGSDIFDKIAAGLKYADDYCRANGWRPLKPGEQEVAKLQFTSLNGQAAVATKVAAHSLADALSQVGQGKTQLVPALVPEPPPTRP